MRFRLYIAFAIQKWAMHSMANWTEDHGVPLNVLVSFYYLKQYNTIRDGVRVGRTMLDSGAFSAHNSGKDIDIHALIAETKNPYWNEAVSLDVIGDGKGSLANARTMAKAGSPAFPVFHIGEPWDLLDAYVAEFPKVGLSCRFGEPVTKSMRWLEECFFRHWPHRYHSFGWTRPDMLMSFPFESADCSSWEYGPTGFGNWKSYGRASIKGQVCLRTEIKHYIDLQERVQARWKRTYEEAEKQNPTLAGDWPSPPRPAKPESHHRAGRGAVGTPRRGKPVRGSA